MPHLASVVASGGTVVMTLRHGPVPPVRRMFEVAAEETIAPARQEERQEGLRVGTQARARLAQNPVVGVS